MAATRLRRKTYYRVGRRFILHESYGCPIHNSGAGYVSRLGNKEANRLFGDEIRFRLCRRCGGMK